MNKVRLFIEKKEVELDKDVTFALTREFEELSNPTVIHNDFSKSVQIPFTNSNNKLFGMLYKTDRPIISSADEFTGQYFDPTIKNDFMLLYDNEVVIKGYCKVNNIKKASGRGYYDITLFGELGKIFTELKKISFEPNVAEPADVKYIINGEDYINDYITKDLVKQSWESTGQTYIDLDAALDHNKWTDIYGFACDANSLNEEFDSTAVQNWDSSNNKCTLKFSEILESQPEFIATNLSADQVIGDGLLPRQFCEFRSYYQQPFIYWNKLWQIFWKKALELPELEDYIIEQDSNWFNNNNPYWKDTVFMLKHFEVKDGDEKHNIYKPSTISTIYDSSSYFVRPEGWDIPRSFNLNMLSSYSEEMPVFDFNTQTFEMNSNILTYGSTLNFTMNIIRPSSETIIPDLIYTIAPESAFIVRVAAIDENDYLLDSYDVAVIGNECTLPLELYDSTVKIQATSTTSNIISFNFNIVTRNILNKFEHQDLEKFRLRLVTFWFLPDNSYPYYIKSEGTRSFWKTSLTLNSLSEFNITIPDKRKRSLAHFTLNDLWNNDYNLFTAILNYCKMFRLHISVDSIDKAIKIEKLTTFFNRYTIEDWSDKVDYSKDFTITPVNWENKYVLFNYKDNDDFKNKKYKDKYGVNYGELKLATDYAFNTETVNLFDNPINNSMNSTENILIWNDLYYGNIIYRFMNEYYIDNYGDDKKVKDNFGSLYFRLGNADFEYANEDEPSYIRKVTITDDTDYQTFNNSYCYLDIWRNSEYESKYVIETIKRPVLSIISNDNLILLNKPKEAYTKQDYSNANSIYSLYWNNYINERYNVQNKKIECYIKLTIQDYINFDFNKLIYIDKCLYMVNKINNFIIGENNLTKVELIQISDINGYLS